MKKKMITVLMVGALASSMAEVPQVTLKVTDSYLHVPVSNNLKAQIDLGLYEGGRLVQDFKVALPHDGKPDWTATYPLDSFDLKGQEISIRPKGEVKDPESLMAAFELMKIGDNLPEEKVSDYNQPYRNQFHASTRRGWNNDPNGMVYHDGKYHLYYQYNPFGIYWGNMHWGHLESTDLIHWEEKPIVLFQKTQKDMMFSGGGFADFNNSAGQGKDTLFIAFTSTGRGECLAYSQDGGQTFTELPENPVVKHKGRDPKIIWYEPEQKWVMIVYNMDPCAETGADPAEGEVKKKQEHNNFAFYESRDLRKWTRTGAFTDPDRGSVYECPEFFELNCGDESRWIVLGAQGRYFIGDFNGKTFIPESGPHGNMQGHSRNGQLYAAQTFSDLPDGRRIQMGWVRMGQPYNNPYPNQCSSQAMTLPHELKLRNTDEGLRLASVPVEELKTLRDGELKKLSDCEGELTEVIIEFESEGWHELKINGIDASFQGKKARIFNDRLISEVYADDGLYYMVRERQPKNAESTETVVKNGKVKSLKIYRLKSIWE